MYFLPVNGLQIIRELLITPLIVMRLLHWSAHLAWQVVARWAHSWVSYWQIFSPSVAPSGIMKVWQQEGSFHICSCLVLPCPISTACGALSNSVFASSDGQPRERICSRYHCEFVYLTSLTIHVSWYLKQILGAHTFSMSFFPQWIELFIMVNVLCVSIKPLYHEAYFVSDYFATLFCFVHTVSMVYSFPHFYLKPVCVFTFKICLLWAKCSSLCFLFILIDGILLLIFY